MRVVFEGGGAKGISHVGALKALEDAGADVPVIAFRLGRGGPPRRWPFVGWVLGLMGLRRASRQGFAQVRSKRRSKLEKHLLDVFETGMFGSQGVVERLVPGLYVVELRSPLSTYDFDGSRDMLRVAYEESRGHAVTALDAIGAKLRERVGPHDGGLIPDSLA